MSIKSWKQVGTTVLAANLGDAKLVIKMFINPQTGRQEDFVQSIHHDWCVVMALTGDEKVLVVSQFKPGCDSVNRGLPLIPLKSGYTPEETVMNEIQKETGYQIENENLVSLGYGYKSPDNSSDRFNCFLVVNCQKIGPGRLDENKNIETCLVPLQDWIFEVMGGIINEPSAVVATVRAMPFLDLHIVPIPE